MCKAEAAAICQVHHTAGKPLAEERDMLYAPAIKEAMPLVLLLQLNVLERQEKGRLRNYISLENGILVTQAWAVQ